MTHRTRPTPFYAAFIAAVLIGHVAQAGAAGDSIRAFMTHCFTKGMTLNQAETRMRAATKTPDQAPLPLTLDFYDTTIAPAPQAHPGTDRRCQVTISGDHTDAAETALLAQMATPPVFGMAGDLPTTHVPTPGTTFIQGRDLPRDRRAVVQVGLRDGNTFIRVDRLAPGRNSP